MGDLTQTLMGPAAALGFGGVTGAIVGYTAKKLTKVVAILVGVVFILVQYLVYKGLISVNWEVVQTTAEGVWQSPDGQTLADRVWEIMTLSLPFGGGFVGGFALGFKLG